MSISNYHESLLPTFSPATNLSGLVELLRLRPIAYPKQCSRYFSLGHAFFLLQHLPLVYSTRFQTPCVFKGAVVECVPRAVVRKAHAPSADSTRAPHTRTEPFNSLQEARARPARTHTLPVKLHDCFFLNSRLCVIYV